jgi:hypothetical protein
LVDAPRRGGGGPDIKLGDRIPLEAYLPNFVHSLVMVPVGDDAPAATIGAYRARRHHATQVEIARLPDVASAAAAPLGRVGLAGAPGHELRPRLTKP